jgi:16S rRNA (cytosine967-C5)-methyltransferase
MINSQNNKKSTSEKNLTTNNAPARLQAMWWLTSVIQDGRSVNDLLANSVAASSESAFAKQLLFGSLRYYHQLKAILDQLISKPLKQKDSDVYSILILGVYQLRYLSTPDHAALSESVELTRKIKKPWASGLVNGILRNYQRQVITIEEKLQKAKTFQFSHPNWIINQLEKDWGEQYSVILEENNQRAPMTIRVDQSVIASVDYIKELNKVDLNASVHQVATDALVLENACDVYQLPGFEVGRVSVQDAAAQLVVDLLDLQPNLTVLDGCAAPGGKTTHILHRQPDVKLTSVEMSENRLKKIEQTLERLDLQNHSHCQLKCADILNIDEWWDGKLFDRILIDVPCSASGVIRRNPDIKIHRKKQDLINIVVLQANILAKVWTLLKPGGRLVYATCSIFKDENENQIRHFLQEHSATIVRLSPEKDIQLKNHSEIGHQIFPGDWQMDGFYLCGLIKPL